MLEKNLDIIYNKPYLVIVPTTAQELLNGFIDTFGNTILMGNTVEEYDQTLAFLSNNNFKKIIFVDYKSEYEKFIYKFKEECEFSFIYTGSLGSLSIEFQYNCLKNIIKQHEKFKNSKLGVLDEGLYKTLKKKYKNIYLLFLDTKSTPTSFEYNENQVAIINESTNPRHSFYNSLSALTFFKEMTAKLPNINKTTKKFLKVFNIKARQVKEEEKLLETNLVNLYINFTGNNPLLILKSMNKGVPCIVGNTTIFDNNQYLKENLVMNSDDDVNEIVEKINLVKKNRSKILREYKIFRKEYAKNSKELVNAFLEFSPNQLKKENKDDLLLSVIVPVYNTEKYLETSLKSIISASIDNMEILVINDGSTDNSEEIILQYQKKYPQLIRYIKQDNHGLGNVRNVGLKEAKGKYLAAIDSDDTINQNFFIDALKYLNKNIDVIIYDWLTITDKSNFETSALDYVYRNINKYKGLLYTTIMPSTCNKIIKRQLFEELKLTYIEDKYEDLSANPFILLKAETIKYINKPYYRYYIRTNSIMRARPGNSMIDVLKVFDERVEKFKKDVNIDLDEFKFHTYAWRIEEYIINPLYDLDNKEMSKSIKYLYKNLKDITIHIFESNHYKIMLEKLQDPKKIKYIKERNKMFKNGQLEEFIIKQKENNNVIKLTPPDVVYGKR